MKAILPNAVRGWCRDQVHRWRLRACHFGLARYCPLCHSFLRGFAPFGVVPRPDALCPVCHALERHRLVWLYFQQKVQLRQSPPIKLLHVAPEPQIYRLLQRLTHIDYVTADIASNLAMVKMDITDIQYPDRSFDAVYCSHVLEHVTEDRKAMAEFLRVLKPGGWAILQVPITAETTVEDPTVRTPEERLHRFGQHDHVRRYGRDYPSRLESVGFAVKVDPFVRTFSETKIRYYGLDPNEEIYYCTKPR